MGMRYGIARGLFSNEAGLGSAPMVPPPPHRPPGSSGDVGIFEVFVDTLLICTTTGLVILVTGVWESGETGAALTGKAFEAGLPGVWGDIVVTTGLVLFAFSTLIGWSYYGETGIVYLLGSPRGAALPARVAGVHLSRRGWIAPPGMEYRRHAERADGDPQPHLRAALDRADPAAAAGVLLAPP